MAIIPRVECACKVSIAKHVLEMLFRLCHCMHDQISVSIAISEVNHFTFCMYHIATCVSWLMLPAVVLSYNFILLGIMINKLPLKLHSLV